MIKLLVNSPSGKQELLQVDDSGAYMDQSSIIWDERTDGALPEITIGKMQRNGSQLVTLEEYLPEHAEAVYQESVPREITMRQAVLALYEAGMLSTVKSWVASVGGELEIYWDTSPVFRRNHAFVEAARVELGLTHLQMDGLFILAATKEP
jgi:hypothetical protein